MIEKIITKIIEEEVKKSGLTLEKIFLFGSRARGEETKESDWDIFVVIGEDVNFATIRKLFSNIQSKFVDNNISADLIIRPKKVFEENSKCVGYISYYANKEGVILWTKE